MNSNEPILNSTEKNNAFMKKHPIITGCLGIILFLIFISVITTAITSNGKNENSMVASKSLGEKLTQEVESINKLSQSGFKENLEAVRSIDTKDSSKAIALIMLQRGLIDTWTQLVIQGEQSTNEEEKLLAKQLREKLISYQKLMFPELRKKYALAADSLLWENDIEVTISGDRNSTITLTGSIFASNKGVQSIQGSISEPVNSLRFKRVNYKWYKYDDEYQYYKIESPSDDVVVTQ